jgi:protein-disulfide isomerase
MQLLIGVVVIAVVLVVLLIVLQPPNTPTSNAFEDVDITGLAQEVDNSSGAPGYAIGDPDAPVTLVEYADFSCTHCADLAPIVHELIRDYAADGNLRVVFKPMTFVYPPYSTQAAQAAICAAQDDKFWQMHDAIWNLYYSSQVAGFNQATLSQEAQSLGISAGSFSACFNSQDTQTALDALAAEAQSLGVQGTPTIFINGQQVNYLGPDDTYDALAAVIDAQLGN